MSKIENSKNNDSAYWKSIREYYDDPNVLEEKTNEFKDGVTDDFNPSDMSKISRRKFLALLTASAAFTATACTNYRDKGEIIPYNKRPDGFVPGIADYYASTIDPYTGNGVLVKTREGRPIKIDGNPEHPINKGKIDSTQQAYILNLYDPERLDEPKFNNRKTSWAEVDSSIIAALNESLKEGWEIAFVTNKVTSPSALKVINKLNDKYNNLKVYSYDLFNDQNKINAWKKSYGTDLVPSIKLDDAKVILSFENDFLGREGNTVENTKKYAANRNLVESTDANRLYVCESTMSLTGSNADYHFSLRPDDQFVFAVALLNELASRLNKKSMVPTKLNSYNIDELVGSKKVDKKKVSYLVDDLIKNRKKSIVYASSILPEDFHIVVNTINNLLEAENLFDFDKAFINLHEYSSSEELNELTQKLNSKEIKTVIHYDCNPVYHLEKYDYKNAVQKADNVITLTEFDNETTGLSNYVLPINHPLESWGDYHVRKGIYSFQQPVINPLFKTRQKESILLTWAIGDSKAYSNRMFRDFLKENVKETVYKITNTASSFNSFWNICLHDGFVNVNEEESKSEKFNFEVLKSIKTAGKLSGSMLVLQQSYFLGDGKFSNNGWLQELPHPISKVTWDNYVAVSPKTAESMDVDKDDVVEIQVADKTLEVPVIIQPGTAENCFVVELGYGREKAGTVAENVGFNTNKLQSKKSSVTDWIYKDVKIKKLNKTYKLASTQEHHAIDDTSLKDMHKSRGIIQEGTIKEYKKDKHFLHHDKHEIFSITEGPDYTGNKWAMTIDLNKCTGCTHCVTSCNVENNIPVVGKDQVMAGREMQWMRIDRYYSGTPEEPSVSTQPMLCQHCDNAPCENVCPVNATNHSPDGLNQMVYNRCVGTRYCANNCPYKVRRFNFFNFRDHFADAYYENDVTQYVHNPEVTVRARGVMEKCTFCVQRIMDARSNAIKEDREVGGNEVVTACQQACPADAIVFGDGNNKDSEVSKLRKHELGYHVLETTNVRPNVTYIAKLRNTHAEDEE